ncbi:MAG: ABC transporter permease [Actinobacteria bacterium]|nr:ABC transporter permease [Actinomycetota bacterium]
MIPAQTAILAQASGPFFRWDWVFRNLAVIWDRTVEHLVLTVIAVGIGSVIALGLSLIALRWRRTYAPITWVTGILYTIPSLALFAMLVPFTGLSKTTAEIGLVSYTLLILIRNIVAGIDGVAPDVKEAALGMGYTRRRLFLEIELPLALPVIVAGIRIATVTVIGLVTVTSLIGLGGLGFFILRGLNSFFWTQIIVGVVLSVVLAVVVDVALARGERALTPWARSRQAD